MGKTRKTVRKNSDKKTQKMVDTFHSKCVCIPKRVIQKGGKL